MNPIRPASLLKSTAIASLLSALALLSPAPAQESPPPNVLFIAVDDLRPQLGAYGHDFMHTPHMDKLAAEGRTFNRHYVQAPTCGASRYALLTGQLPNRRISLSNNAFDLYTQGHAPISFPQLFRENGYTTVQIGKISHSADGYEWRQDGPQYHRTGDRPEVPDAWDTLTTPAGQWKTPWFAFFGYQGGDTRRTNFRPPLESADVDDSGYPDALIAESAIEQLRELHAKDQPFLLAVGFFKPHLPFTAPKKYWDLYDRDTIDISDVDPVKRTSGEFFSYSHNASQTEDPAYVRELRHGYYASTSYVDAQVGKVLDALDELNLRDNTIVVLWGDHGYHLGELGYWGKHTLHEHSLRTAFLMRTPNMPQPGIPTNALSATIDIYPTLVDLAGLPMPNHLDGTSFKPVLNNPNASTSNHVLSFWGDKVTIRTDRYRLTGPPNNAELYDHHSKAAESINIATQNQNTVRELDSLRSKSLNTRKAK